MAAVCLVATVLAVAPRASAAPVAVDVAVAGESSFTLWSDGSVVASGDGEHHGDVAGRQLNGRPLAIEATPSGGGYWIVGADGGIFTFGNATFHGSTGNKRLNAPIIDMAATPTGAGYWLLGADGGIFTFGNATFHGSAVGRGVAVAVEATTGGYQVTTASGQTIDFADTTPPEPPDPEPAIGEIVRISVASDGSQANAPSDPASYDVSADGRYVAFDSSAANLVPGDTNDVNDVFVHDLWTGDTTRVSVSSSGEQANGPSGSSRDDPVSVSISADGRYVAFDSGASNLVASDTNDEWDVFLHDRATGLTTRVSVSSSTEQGDGESLAPSLSADGTRVAFMSSAPNLIGTVDDTFGVLVHDTTTGLTELASSNGDPEARFNSIFPAISGDGRVVAWLEEADTGLIPGIFATEVLIKDTETGVLTAARPENVSDEHLVSPPVLSANGRLIAYGLADSGTMGRPIRFDRDLGVTVELAVDPDGGPPDRMSDAGGISDDGNFVAFQAYATNLVTGDTNEQPDIFVRDVDGGTTQRVSVAVDGTESNGPSNHPQISGDGRYVVFMSEASNLVDGDTNGVEDVFVVRLR